MEGSLIIFAFLFIGAFIWALILQWRIFQLKSLIAKISKSKLPSDKLYGLLVFYAKDLVRASIRIREYDKVLFTLCSLGKVKSTKTLGHQVFYDELVDELIAAKQFSRDWRKIPLKQEALKTIMKDKKLMEAYRAYANSNGQTKKEKAILTT